MVTIRIASQVILVLMSASLFLSAQPDPKRPHIYVALERRFDKEFSLRLTNNSEWAIRVCSRSFVPNVRPNVRPVELRDGKTISAFTDGFEAPLCYGVERFSNSKLTVAKLNSAEASEGGRGMKDPFADCKFNYCGFYDDGNYGGTGWIAPGTSVILRVSTVYLRDDYQIYIKYQYEWESDSIANPRHATYFRSFGH